MKIPLTVGIIIGLIFFISFAGWLYNLITGAGKLVIDDKYYLYRIVATILASVLFMVLGFFLIATISECNREKREGVFTRLKCDHYQWLRSRTENFFKMK